MKYQQLKNNINRLESQAMYSVTFGIPSAGIFWDSSTATLAKFCWKIQLRISLVWTTAQCFSFQASKRSIGKKSQQLWPAFWRFGTMTMILSNYKSSHDCRKHNTVSMYTLEQLPRCLVLHISSSRERTSLFVILRHQITYFWYCQKVWKNAIE